ncbi:MAG: LVIVD repeat-containing protein [Rhodothermales bacterium]
MASLVFFCSQPVGAQQDGMLGSRNMDLVGHLPLGGMQSPASPSAGFEALGRGTGHLALDQEPGRPFVFVAREDAEGSEVVAISINDPSHPLTLGSWRPQSHSIGDLTLFSHGSRHYLAVTHADGLSVREVSDPKEGQFDAAADVPREPGYHHVFAYRHSNGRSYLLATGGGDIDVYDVDRLLSSQTDPVASYVLPETVTNVDYGYHAVTAQWHADTESDRLYAAGAGGYYVFDVTDPSNPSLLTEVNSAAVQIGHAVSASPDGTHLVTAAGYRTAPIRIFDLRPTFEGAVPRIRVAAGAWTADWRNLSENHELRWPFVFAASMDDGLQVFNMMNPFEPYTVGFYDTWDGPRASLANERTHRNGAWDVDVRNHDGLVAVTDVNTGLWLIRMEGFEGWDGRGWGFANVSTVQDWDNGPTQSERW